MSSNWHWKWTRTVWLGVERVKLLPKDQMPPLFVGLKLLLSNSPKLLLTLLSWRRRVSELFMFPFSKEICNYLCKVSGCQAELLFFLVFTWRFCLHKWNVPLSGPVFSVSLWSFLGQFLGVLLASAWLRLTHLGRRPEEVHLPVALQVVHSAVLCSTSTILEHWILVVQWFSEQRLRRFDLSACRDVAVWLSTSQRGCSRCSHFQGYVVRLLHRCNMYHSANKSLGLHAAD